MLLAMEGGVTPALTRAASLLACVVLLVGCSVTVNDAPDASGTDPPSSASSSATSPATASPTPVPCIDRTVYAEHKEAAARYTIAADRALHLYDLTTFASKTHLAALEARLMASEARAGGERELAAHLMQGASHLDHLASALQGGDAGAALAWQTQAEQELREARTLSRSATYC